MIRFPYGIPSREEESWNLPLQRVPNLTILDPVALLWELALERQRQQKPEHAPERERGRDINH